MRHRCWGSVFLEDRLSLFHEARAAAVDRWGACEMWDCVLSDGDLLIWAVLAERQMGRGAVCAGVGAVLWRGVRLVTVYCTRFGVLLGEGWVYCMGVGGSCSMDNPWPVDPDPRGVGPGRQVAGLVPTSSQGRRLPTLVECGFPGRVGNHRCANATSIHRADRSG